MAISVTFSALALAGAFLHVLPEAAENAVGEMLLELGGRLIIPSNGASGLDTIYRYGRGNVLYQIGQMRDSKDLHTQKVRSDQAMSRLARITPCEA